MNAAMVFGRGLSFPPRLGRDGGFAWSEGPENIREAIRVLLLTETGERVRRPEFGGDLRRLLFEPNTAATRRTIRDRIEAARPKPPIQQMRERARAATPEPTLNPSSRIPLDVHFNNASLKSILDFLSTAIIDPSAA